MTGDGVAIGRGQGALRTAARPDPDGGKSVAASWSGVSRAASGAATGSGSIPVAPRSANPVGSDTMAHGHFPELP